MDVAKGDGINDVRTFHREPDSTCGRRLAGRPAITDLPTKDLIIGQRCRQSHLSASHSSPRVPWWTTHLPPTGGSFPRQGSTATSQESAARDLDYGADMDRVVAQITKDNRCLHSRGFLNEESAIKSQVDLFGRLMDRVFTVWMHQNEASNI